MIGFLRGTVVHSAVDHCLLDVHDVGYRVFVSRKTCAHIAQGEEALLYIYTHVREDAILLYGFFSQEEYDLFQHLIGISGIGPKGAQSILSEVTPHDFYRLIHKKDVKGITKLPGIGKKTAERMILELRGKLASAGSEGLALFDANKTADNREDVVQTLLALGYVEREARAAVKNIASDVEVGDGVRQALKKLSK